MSTVHTVRSADGTTITFERTGSGPELLLVAGSVCDRTYWAPVVPALAAHFTVVTVDRRGRGDSGDVAPYAVEREAEDVLAVVEALRGPVHLLGHSYGGIVALEAARRTGDLATLTLYEPAYGLTGTIPEGFVAAVEALVAAGERDEATALMMRELVGLPDEPLAELRSDPAAWKPMADSVHTLPRELRTVGTFAFEPARYSTVTVPTVLLAGAMSPPDLHIGVGLVRDAVDGRVVTMAGVDHEAVTTGPEVLVDAILDAVPGASGIDERLVDATVGTLELFGVHLGTRLGLYRALRDRGPLTSDELAAAAGIHERYAREWLEQQAVAGFLTVDDAGAPAGERRYRLPARNAGALADPDDPAHVAPLADMVIGIAGALGDVLDAYRSGGGVPYARYGADFRRGQGGVNRPAFRRELTGTWLPAMPDLHARLAAPGARIADVGCGHGWSTAALAAAYPQAEVFGLDSDQASVTEARVYAADSPARFAVTDAAEIARHGPFDAVLLLECLHDLTRPVEVLAACRAALADGGAVVVADENVAPDFTAPGDVLERMMYGWSVSHCLPAAMAEVPSAALGTVLRPATVDGLARAAGFAGAQPVDVDAGFFRLYRLDG